MSAPSVGAELRRYRALAWAVVATLIVSVALFVQFLRMDVARAADAFSSRVAYAAANGERQITRLTERLETMGREHLSGASDAQLLSLMRALDLDEAHVSLCVRRGDTTRVLHAVAGVASTARARCAAGPASARPASSSRDEDPFPTGLQVLASARGDAPWLDFRVSDGDSRELRATLDAAALLDALVLGDAALNADEDTVCLSLRVGATFRELACHAGAIVPDAFGATDTGAAGSVSEIEAGGARWRLTVTPDPRSLAGTMTPLPFVMFGLALAVGVVACAFAYRAADRSILLETRAEELRTRLARIERLEEQNGLLDQFAAMAAHDLQAPLRFIVSNAHLLTAELDEIERPDLSRMATVQVEQGERMRALMLDLLRFCRAGQGRLATAPVDVRALVDEEVRLLRTHEEYARTRIVVGPLPDDALVCDADKLSRIVRNLLGNAVKFSQGRAHPEVSISASRDTLHGAWTFRVRDNGPGVDEEHHDRIFRPFARLDSGTEGTGMGLAIVRLMLERHGGTIRIEPADTGGCTFTFTMPGSLSMETSS